MIEICINQTILYMKNLFLIVFSFLVFFLSCSKSDPCEGISCLNGGECADGKCLCPNGFEGTLCDKESLPKAVIVTAIKVTKLPANKTDGTKWDADGTNPDLYPALYTLKADNTADQVLWTSDVIKINAQTNQQHDFTLILPKLSINNYDKTLGLFLLEKDDSSSENMGGIAFQLKEVVKGKPAMISLDCATCKVAYELKVTYE